MKQHILVLGSVRLGKYFLSVITFLLFVCFLLLCQSFMKNFIRGFAYRVKKESRFDEMNERDDDNIENRV